MDSADLAYAAGVIDGDGYLVIRPNAASYQPCIGITITNQEVILWFVSFFGGRLLQVDATDKEEELFRWEISAKDKTVETLTQILPYLKIKRVHALILLEFCRKFPSVSTGVRYTDKQKNDMTLYHRIMTVANSKGPGSNAKKLKLFNALTGNKNE